MACAFIYSRNAYKVINFFTVLCVCVCLENILCMDRVIIPKYKHTHTHDK